MRLSIVIPAREEERSIATTVTQFRALTLPHEVIVSDAKSTDRTVARAQEAGAKVVVFTGERHTAGIGRNDGAKIAEGEFIAFIDADVRIPDPETFFTQALRHFTDPRIVAVTCAQRAEPTLETWADRLNFGYLNVVIRLQNNLLRRGEANGKFMLVRRSAFTAVRGFREDIATREDGDFFYRLSRIGRTVFDPRLRVYHGARRAHRLGWPRLWYIWTINIIYFALTDHAYDDDWTPIR